MEVGRGWGLTIVEVWVRKLRMGCDENVGED